MMMRYVALKPVDVLTLNVRVRKDFNHETKFNKWYTTEMTRTEKLDFIIIRYVFELCQLSVLH